ncbi:MAG: CHAD domain-containing protein [Burkholderiaceae bacterium]
MAAEVELKLALAARSVAPLLRRLSHWAEPQVEWLDNIYFDTAEGLLARHRMGLRLRRQASGWVQTLKTAGAEAALSRRGEWEMPVRRRRGQPRLDLKALADTPLADLLARHPASELAAVFETRFQRTRWEFDCEGARIEVALDRGHVSANARRAPIRELELELKSGPPSALIALALRLAQGSGRQQPLSLVPATESKAARGYRLASNLPLAPSKASAAALGAGAVLDLPADAALRQVAAGAAAVIAANERGLAESDDAEFVHQARVALRRWRSALRLLDRRDRFPVALTDELRWLAGVLGAARDADVLAAAILPALLAGAVSPAAVKLKLQAQADAERQAARQQLRVELASPRYALLALGLLAWAHAPSQGKRAVERVASPRLARQRQRLIALGEGLAAAPDELIHEARVRAKCLRYGIELLGSGADAVAWDQALAQLQAELGAAHDATVAGGWVEARRVPPALRAELLRACRETKERHALAAERVLASMAELRVFRL